LYRFKVRNNLTNRRRQILITAKVFTDDESLPEEYSAEEIDRYRRIDNLWIRTPMILLPEHRIAMYPFPNDLAMPWLIDAVDPLTMKQRFRRIWSYQNIKVRKVKVKVLGYTPQMRASFLYDILIDDNQTKQRQWRHLIGKTNVFKSPDRLFAGAWALWQACRGNIGFARPVGFMNNPDLTLQEKIEGKRLGSLVDSPSFDVIIQNTARAIANFHSLSIPLRTKRKLKDEIRSIDRWSDVLVKIRPDLKSRIELFRSRLKNEIESRMSIRTPVHADFHHTNVFVDGTTVRLIDLDEMAYGDPCVDIGRFLASLRIPSLRAFGNIDALSDMRELFLRKYLDVRPEEVRNIRLFESAALLTSAASAFRIQRPNWENEIEILLEQAEQVFNSSRISTVVSISSNLNDEDRLPSHERFRWAMDATYMQTVLTSSIRDSYNAELVACKVLKSKKLSRGHKVKYKLFGWSGENKWKREISGLIIEKRGARTIFSRLCRIRKHLRKNNSPLLLPRPIAFIPQISTLIIEEAKGKSFSSLLQTNELESAATKLAAALSTFHKINIESDKAQSPKRELKKICRKLEKLKQDNPEFYAKAEVLYSVIETRKVSVDEKVSPVVDALRLGHVLLSGDGISISDITKLKYSHPYFDVGNFLAQLILTGLKKDNLRTAKKAAENFHNSYQSEAQVEAGELLPFEVMACLLVACTELKKKQNDSIAFGLLDYAHERINNG
jgi:aminoglycoside phosphotransferase (APT) family kinase protein